MRYRCPDKRCRKTASIRIGSIFEDSKLTLIESTRLIFHYFLENVARTQVLKELPIVKNTVTDIYSTIRECISDESLFSHLDGNQVWVLGLYDRKTQEARAFVLEDRTANTLLPLIQENIVPGVRIYTDGWMDGLSSVN